jgi:hypothetical protein
MVGAVAETSLARVRAWWRVQHPPPGLGRYLDLAYTTAITTAIFGAMAYGTASSALAQVVTPHALAVYGPSLALVAVLLTARWGAFQGPVVFPVADVAFLLGAPLPRRDLARRRLALAFAGGAVAGALAAGLVIVGLAGEGRGIALVGAAGVAIAITEVGMLGVASAWAVERSARWERTAWLAAWPGLALAAGLAAASDAAGISWSGPGAWVALALLTVAAAGAVVAAMRACGECPTERHLLRAEARANALASLASFDVRTARRTFEPVGGRGPGRAEAGVRRPRSPRLAIPWRDVVAARRTPGRVVEAAVLVAAGAVVALLDTTRPVALAAGLLLVYLGAARVIWPLRAELDSPARLRALLVPRIGRVLLAHTAFPALVAASAAALGAAGCAIAGALPAHGAATAALAVAATPLLIGSAGMSARRGGRLPASVLGGAIALDPSGGGGALVLWFMLWPAVGVVLATATIALATHGSAAAAAGWTLIAAGTLAALLGRDLDA